MRVDKLTQLPMIAFNAQIIPRMIFNAFSVLGKQTW